MTRPVRVVPARAATVPALLDALAAALDGTGPAVLPVDDGPGTGVEAGGAVPDEVALLVRTSGSTGTPREVMLSAAALTASARATYQRLSGPGAWLLPLPPAHVAGLQVLVRSLVAGTVPEVLDGPFRPDAFAAATARLDAAGLPRYTSLVPTQVHRLLDDPAGRAALAAYDAVLLGGAAAPPALVARARDTGARVVTTYGMSETSGGCVYDGVPLDGVTADLDADGRIRLAGPVLATGYRDRPDLDSDLFTTEGGTRWLRTSDLGRWVDGRLEVLGRADDVLVTGGEKVAPAAVERVLAGRPGVGEVLVVGVPDPEWGQALVAVVVPGTAAAPDLGDLRDAAATALGRAAAPRHLVTVDALPLRGPGKPDRSGAATLAARALGRD
ncbi:o-succinylbenzoate--CoA ligase [Cellulomonas triticagri]|uniref:AMP-dependent synthetase n=1 Tax=Cellulomonas triticagri TaxID=2483352 RepID=A0A3M2JQY1_9CELL|nr:o-succinylbenzoate--CoA ligase [Cellulomonas triticagri]RMI13155.1 AMP-dependent synthetase [Cellulomonas triticagri]